MSLALPDSQRSERGASAVARGVLLVGLAVLGARQVRFGLGGERVVQGIAAAVAVLGVLDQVGLGLLEALGLPAAGLVDRAHLGVEVVFVAGDPADPACVGGSGR